MRKDFLLSVVATTRNDNHGGSLTYRMQHFVDGFVKQCKKHDLSAELILVEWNPPDNKPPLSEALNFPAEKGPCAIRIVRVPKEVHMRLSNSNNLPLFQMIGKNVGIKRALGKFVLSTNIDILFSDALIQYLRNQLKPGILYRVDRLDVPQNLPVTESFNEILTFCAKNFFRINGKFGTKNVHDKTFLPTLRKMVRKSVGFLKGLLEQRLIDFLLKPIPFALRTIKNLYSRCHTNACGDFTLLSSEDWADLKGYPEWPFYSWHIDSVLLHQAKRNGIKEIDLPRKLPIYHIEHEIGSGYTHEAPNALFKRLEAKGIPYLKNSDLQNLIDRMNKSKKKVLYNDENWGMSDQTFEEVWV